MNTELFHYSLDVALDAYALKQGANFAVAIRVAQSALNGFPRLCTLLDSALQQYPSPEVPQLLHSIGEIVPRESSHQAMEVAAKH